MDKWRNKNDYNRKRDNPTKITKRQFTGVEDVLGLGGNRLWYPVLYHTGYEVSNDGYLRSLKLTKAYPYGILLKPNKDDQYTLMNDRTGKKDLLTIREIQELVEQNPHAVGRPTKKATTAARNSRKFLTQPAGKNPRKSGMFTIIDDEPNVQDVPRPPHFTVIKDEPEEPSRKGWCPIYQIKKG